jgi:hypothetical protein
MKNENELLEKLSNQNENVLYIYLLLLLLYDIIKN